MGVSNESSYVRYNMNSLGPGERLYYYNPICIVFTHTFTRQVICQLLGFFCCNDVDDVVTVAMKYVLYKNGKKAPS